MKLSIISFTEKGKHLSEKIAEAFKGDDSQNGREDRKLEISLYTKCRACMGEKHSAVLPVESSLGEWTKEQMQRKNALLFIGACGIAVRAVAPFVTDKLQDGPVLVMDERGNYVIPILSGHVGGANELANDIAGKTGAEPVITTATDVNQKFAVDVFAKKNGLSIVNKDGIVKVSSKVLAEKEITLSVEGGQEGMTPEGVRLLPYPPAESADIVISSEDKEFDAAILLKPKEYVIGLGCRRGKSLEEIDRFIRAKLGELGISLSRIFALASISQKKDEEGILLWCQKEGIDFLTYTAEELQRVTGNFKSSAFVKAQVGVDNVCERAALNACEKGVLIASKYAQNGMTIAVAKRKWRVCFYDE